MSSTISKYVMGGEMEISKIKNNYHKAAGEAKTKGELDAAMGVAAKAADAALAKLEKQLQGAVEEGKISENFEGLEDAKASIKTALAAGRAEVRLNHASNAVELESAEFDKEASKRLNAAKTDAEVVELLKEAQDYAAKQKSELDK
jgi:hypothetical protein